MTAIALHLGLNAVDPSHYDGWSGDLAGCEHDARDLAALTRAQGFSAEVVLTQEARAERVRAFLERGARLRAGDRLVLTFSGHGTQVPATDDPGETDGLDEAWVLYDRLLLDGEVYQLLGRLAAGVRALVVLDCCHSGTAIRDHAIAAIRGPGRAAPAVVRGMPGHVARAAARAHPDVYRRARAIAGTTRELRPLADTILLAACQDHQVALDGAANGAFTGALLRAWDGGRFAGDHRGLLAQVTAALPSTQRPNLDSFGPSVERYVAERPFTAGEPGHSLPEITTMTNQAQTIHGNWDEVYAELERKLGDARADDSLGSRMIAANAEAARLAFFGPGAVVPVPVASRSALAAARGGTVARAFWWGFHIQISHEDLMSFLSAADPINALIGAIGGGIPSPAAPFIALAAAFVAGALGILRGVDKGRGVYVSMSWFAPGIFIPTTV